jgi:hypothetical protein
MVVAAVSRLTGRIDMAMRTLSLAAVLLFCGIYSAFPWGNVSKDDPWVLTILKICPPRFGNTSQASAKGRREPNMILQPTHHSRGVGGSIWNISTARAWGEFRRGNQCLDVDFVEVGSRFRIASKQYRDCGF